jgi:hypothetical protein
MSTTPTPARVATSLLRDINVMSLKPTPKEGAVPTKRKSHDKYGWIQLLRLIIVVTTLAPIIPTPVRHPQINTQLPTQDTQAISCTLTIPAPNELPQTMEFLYSCPTKRKYRPHTHAS